MYKITLEDKPKRQSRPKAFKLKLVEQAIQPGASISGIAIEHGVNPNLLSKWIRIHRHEVSNIGFLPVYVNNKASSVLEPAKTQGQQAEPIKPQVHLLIERGDLRIQTNLPDAQDAGLKTRFDPLPWAERTGCLPVACARVKEMQPL